MTNENAHAACVPVSWALSPQALWVQDRAGNLAIIPPRGLEAEPLRVGTPGPWPWFGALSEQVTTWDGDILGASALNALLGRYHLTIVFPPLRRFDPARGYYVRSDE